MHALKMACDVLECFIENSRRTSSLLVFLKLCRFPKFIFYSPYPRSSEVERTIGW